MLRRPTGTLAARRLAALASLMLVAAVATVGNGCEDARFQASATRPETVARSDTAHAEAPSAPPETAPWTVSGGWSDALVDWLRVPAQTGTWRWSTGTPSDSGIVTLTTNHAGYRWRFDGPPPLGSVRVDPPGNGWLSLHVPNWHDLAAVPPLPELSVQTEAYPHLVAMLRDLLEPRFGGVVPHWPGQPVPVAAPAAVSGEVDLAACLREAVTNWNTTAASSLLAWDPEATWGIHLAHYAGSLRNPPLQTQLIRRDAVGRPWHVRIAVGDDYSTRSARPYAVRGLAHELGHALLLWGHTADRHHLLWGDAPPLRATPSRDEVRAVELRQLLPRGLDLAHYRD
jgi:hypothetical protein